MMTCEELVFDRLPVKLVKTLMPFQREGIINAVQKNGRCLIADEAIGYGLAGHVFETHGLKGLGEMGLGKTIQALSVAYYYHSEWPLLIIVPSSLRYSWVEELEKWLPDVGPNDVNVIQYGSDVGGIPSALITIASYGLLCKNSSNLVREALFNQNFQVVIVDESHYIRNQKTASCKAVVPLIKNANRRLLLSGTPALARPVELFPQIDAICPGEFGSWWSFTSRYCDAKIEWIGRIKRRRVDGASNLEELQAMLTKKLMIRRAKDEVLTQLPPKQRQKVLFDLKESDIKKEIRKTFEELKPLLKMKNNSMAEILTGGGEDSPANYGTLGLIQRLYKLSGEAKIGPAKEYVEMLCENQNLKFLVFAYHHAMMNGLQQSLMDKKVKFIRIDGGTKPSERLHLVQQFQSDPEMRVAILSILAAGVGLTLTAAKLVMFAEMYWTPGVMIQCEDRAHRIGQTSSLPVHYLVAKDTMDEWVWSAVCKKTIVTTMTLNGQKQILQAYDADKYQVDILSNAEAWIPDQNDEELDLLNYFQSQQSNGQKSILDYFSSQSSKGSSQNNSGKIKSPKKKQKDSPLDLLWKDDCVNIDNKYVTENENIGLDSPGQNTPKSDPKKKARSRTQRVLVINISDDDEDFVSKEKSSKKLKKTISNQKTSEVENGSRRTCKLNLVEKFSGQNDSNDNESDFDLGFEFSHSSEDFGNMDQGEITKVQPNSCDANSMETNDVSWSTSTPFAKKSNLLPMFSAPQYDGSSIKKSQKSEHGQPVGQSSLDSLSCLKKEFDSNNQSNLEIPFRLKKEKEDIIQSDEFTELSNHLPNKDNVTGSAHWGCSVCTYLNHHELPYCEMCETPKKEQMLPHPATRSCVKIAPGLQFGFTKNDRTDQKNMKRNLLQHSSGKNSKHLGVKLENETVSEEREDTSFEESIVSDLSVDINEENSFEQINSTWNSINARSSPFSCNLERSQPFQWNENCPLEMTPCKPTCTPVIMHNIVMNSCKNNLKLCGNKGKVISKDRIIVTDGSIKTMDDKIKKRGEKRKRSSFDKEDEGKDMLDITEYDSSDEKNVSKVDITYSGDGHLHTEHAMQMGLHDLHPAADDSQTGCVTKSTDCVTSVNSESTKVVDLDKLPVYNMFQFSCSKYTGRVYLYDQDGISLYLNFLPMDIEVGNHDDLPDLLLHPSNMQLVQRFVREWNSLTETKHRLIIKMGLLFVSPLRAYEDIKSCKTVCTQRNKTKLDTAALAAKKAAETGGSVRVISRRNNSQNSGDGLDKGVAQVVNYDGTPLCIHCQKPYENKCLTNKTIVSENNAWKTRFCSYQCAQDYWIQTSSSYCRDKILEAEHGICQLCGFDAQTFYKHVRDTTNLQKRAELISQSKFSTLTGKQKEQMVRKPVEGQFWHVDHILPVWEGGGECDIDNLRTLCVICHKKVTANQARKRAIVNKLGTVAKSGDITAFFQPR